ncbi:hypothetical protein [Bradyrhizobium sp. Leo121]|uniref:hypothetical protein n=1 Tax=Bradyrhizobium sp. Leo121 TaxID=1571195 RepID=UPI0010298E3C|nr:hypothetical protein [Bradyrhizobium sp. Leo121]RZN32605.1 hypothetical protein CWO90_12790 [Bradyrhizobium sp. Leo121]
MRGGRIAWAAAIVLSAIILIAGLVLDRRAALAAYLVAWIALGAIAIGALGVLMTSYLVRRAWTEALHPVLVAATATLPVVGICLVPVLIGMKEIYPAAAATSTLPPFKAAYLAPLFFTLRSVIYFVIWSALAVWLRNAWSHSERMTRAASAGLIVYALTVSLAGIDWMESLEPHFHSSVYGLLYLTLALLNGLAFAIGWSILTGRQIGGCAGYSALLLSTILLWGYLHAMQYIVIWAGDIPDEVIWYLKRSENGWQFALAILVAGQFVLPFFALLSGRVRADRRWLLGLCALTLLMRVLEAAILILPAIDHVAPLTTAVMLAAALVFVGALLLWMFDAMLCERARWISATVQHVRAEGEPGSGRPAR